MKNKTLVRVLLAIFIVLPLIAVVVFYSRGQQVPEVAKNFPVSLLQQNTTDGRSAEPTPSLLIFYNPGCDHCQREASELSVHPDFKDISVFWLSGATMEENDTFKVTYAANAPANFYFLNDPEYQIADAFEVSTFPTIFIYSAEGALCHRYVGETEPSDILKWLD